MLAPIQSLSYYQEYQSRDAVDNINIVLLLFFSYSYSSLTLLLLFHSYSYPMQERVTVIIKQSQPHPSSYPIASPASSLPGQRNEASPRGVQNRSVISCRSMVSKYKPIPGKTIQLQIPYSLLVPTFRVTILTSTSKRLPFNNIVPPLIVFQPQTFSHNPKGNIK